MLTPSHTSTELGFSRSVPGPGTSTSCPSLVTNSSHSRACGHGGHRHSDTTESLVDHLRVVHWEEVHFSTYAVGGGWSPRAVPGSGGTRSSLQAMLDGGHAVDHRGVIALEELAEVRERRVEHGGGRGTSRPDVAARRGGCAGASRSPAGSAKRSQTALRMASWVRADCRAGRRPASPRGRSRA